MTKFKELDNDQKGAFKDLMLRAVDRRIKEDIEYTQHSYRLLIIGNGAGIALLASFIGAIVGRGNPAAGALIAPLWKFFLGCFLAAMIYAPLTAVAAQATTHAGKQTIEFFQNKLDLEDVQGWGLSARGRLVVNLLTLASLISFCWAVFECIQILKRAVT